MLRLESVRIGSIISCGRFFVYLARLLSCCGPRRNGRMSETKPEDAGGRLMKENVYEGHREGPGLYQ